jgi:hypothetical protein
MRVLSFQVGQARRAFAAALGMFAAGCSNSKAPDDVVNPVREHPVARIVLASEALSGANIPTVDPATMNDAEIRKALGAGPHCSFRYTTAGKPVLALQPPSNAAANLGAVKLNGSLVILKPAPSDRAILLVADEVRLTLAPDEGGQDAKDRQEASLVFEIDGSLRVGYRGYYDCGE